MHAYRFRFFNKNREIIAKFFYRAYDEAEAWERAEDDAGKLGAVDFEMIPDWDL